MDGNKLEHFRQLLIKEKNEILNTIKQMNENEGIGGIGERDYYHELSLIDNHPADIASEVYETEKNYALKENEEHILNQIEDALKKMQDGSYGICNHCHKPIEEDRLEALPYTALCAKCAKDNDLNRNDLKNSRPNEERLLRNPFSVADINEKGEIQFDVEDSYQEVARFNKTKNGLDNYDDVYDDENVGYVEKTDKISNEDYKKTL